MAECYCSYSLFLSVFVHFISTFRLGGPALLPGAYFPDSEFFIIDLVNRCLVTSVALHVRIATLQQQLDDAIKEIEEMKAARRRQTEMVGVDDLLCYGRSCNSFQF